MNSWLSGISILISDNHSWGYFFAFLFAFLEALPIFGTIIPGLIIIPFIGLYIGNGVLPALTTFHFTFLGAFVGDVLSFWLGRIYSGSIKNWHWFNKHQKHVIVAQSFIERFGAYCVIIGRFIGPMRSSVPFFTGILGLNPTSFFFAAIISAWLWSIVYLTPGILAGAFSMNIPPEIMTSYLVSIISIVIACEIIRKRHSVVQKIALQLGKNEQSCLHLISGIVTGFTLIYIVLTLPKWVTLNESIWHLMISFQTLLNVKIALVLSIMADRVTLCITTALCIILLISQKKIKTAIHLGIKMLLIVGIILILKQIIFSARPNLNDHFFNSPLLHTVWDRNSFPSGHVGLLTMFLLTITSWQRQSTPWFNRLSCTLIISICVSRILLSEHWATDVFASILLASCLHHCYELMLVRIGSHNHDIHYKTALAFLLTTTAFIAFFSNDLKTEPYYITNPPTTVIEGPLKESHHFPWVRTNRLGYQADPFNLIIAGDPTQIAETMLTDNWHIQPDLGTTIYRLANLLNQYALITQPLFPALHLNSPPVFIAHKTTEEGLLIVKLWDSKKTWNSDNHLTPMLIGNIQLKSHPISWYNLTMPLTSDAYDQLKYLDHLFEKVDEDKPISANMHPCWNGQRWFLRSK